MHFVVVVSLLLFFCHRTLRSLSSLITLTPDELAKKSIEIDGPVSPFIVLLLMFGHAGSDLASPHVAAGWSNEKITEWLSTHVSIRDRYYANIYLNSNISIFILLYASNELNMYTNFIVVFVFTPFFSYLPSFVTPLFAF